MRGSSGIVFAVVLVLASPARAQTPAVTSAQSSAAALPAPTAPLGASLTGPAKADYDAGALLFRNNDYAGALVKFQSAYDHSKEPGLLFNIGVCEKNLRHYARTIAFFERYRAEAGNALLQADRDQVDRYLNELRPFVANLQIVSDEPGATISLDGSPAGTTPLSGPLRVDIGQRHVKVAKDGFADYTVDVSVTGTGDLTVAAKMERITHEAHLAVQAEPGDTIVIDDQPGVIGRFDGVLPSGGHWLKVTASGKKSFQTEVVLQDNHPRTLDVKLDADKGHGVPAWVWIGGGILLAGGIGVGSYYALKPGTTTASPPSGTMGVATLSFH